jgi:hypothetical protein
MPAAQSYSAILLLRPGRQSGIIIALEINTDISQGGDVAIDAFGSEIDK